jgi:hypothetical protein
MHLMSIAGEPKSGVLLCSNSHLPYFWRIYIYKYSSTRFLASYFFMRHTLNFFQIRFQISKDIIKQHESVMYKTPLKQHQR